VDPSDPCGLLSPEQVQAAVGTKVQDGEEIGSILGSTRICSYKTAEPWASVQVYLEEDVSAHEFNKPRRSDPANTESVPGIGDGAFIAACAGISVLTRNVLVAASVQHLTTCDETDVVLEKLGRTIVKTVNTTASS
jgi:hypothetical protein